MRGSGRLGAQRVKALASLALLFGVLLKWGKGSPLHTASPWPPPPRPRGPTHPQAFSYCQVRVEATRPIYL